MNEVTDSRKRRSTHGFRWAVVGFVIGMALTAVAVWTLMPSMMIITQQSTLGHDETVAALEKSVVANGWVLSGVRDMNKSLAKHGVDFKPRVKLVELCNPQYAQSVLASDRHIATMMPCTLAVWESDDGQVYVSRMNLGLMARMFGGNVAEVMAGKVVADEARILDGLLQK